MELIIFYYLMFLNELALFSSTLLRAKHELACSFFFLFLAEPRDIKQKPITKIYIYFWNLNRFWRSARPKRCHNNRQKKYIYIYIIYIFFLGACMRVLFRPPQLPCQAAAPHHMMMMFIFREYESQIRDLSNFCICG